MTTSLTLIIVIVVITIVLFIILREFTCWYFKINKQIELQQATLRTLLKMYERDGGEVNWESANKTLSK